MPSATSSPAPEPPGARPMREAVVLVHGIWMRGGVMFALNARLREAGYTCHSYTYASVRRSAPSNAERLQAFAASLDAEVVHFVGHSLGGIVLLHLFHRYPEQRPGRVVLIGSPVRGSAVAQRGAGNPLSRMLLGNSLRAALSGGTPPWSGARALGIIAGSRPIGVGLILGGLRGPHDGTVAVAETRLDNAVDHIVLPVSHMGMVLSRRVARQVCAFLHDGGFNR